MWLPSSLCSPEVCSSENHNRRRFLSILKTHTPIPYRNLRPFGRILKNCGEFFFLFLLIYLWCIGLICMPLYIRVVICQWDHKNSMSVYNRLKWKMIQNVCESYVLSLIYLSESLDCGYAGTPP